MLKGSFRTGCRIAPALFVLPMVALLAGSTPAQQVGRLPDTPDSLADQSGAALAEKYLQQLSARSRHPGGIGKVAAMIVAAGAGTIVGVAAQDEQVADRPYVGASMALWGAANAGLGTWGSVACNRPARELERVRGTPDLIQRETAGVQALQRLARQAQNDRLTHSAFFVLLAGNSVLDWKTSRDRLERFPARGIVFGLVAILCLIDRTPAEQALKDYHRERELNSNR